MIFRLIRKFAEMLYWSYLTLKTLYSGLSIKLGKLFRFNFRRLQYNHSMQDPSEFGLMYSRVSFPSLDGLNLRGWWFETQKDMPTIILLHGVRANRAEPAERVFGIAEDLIEYGYNILTFDFRGHGESDGNRISAGYDEKNDLLGAVKYIRSQGVTGKIGVLGFSMGAAISLMASAECKEISAVIADSSFVDVVSILESQFSRRKYLPGFLLPALIFLTKTLYKLDLTKIKPVEAVKKIHAPVFIIHGGLDGLIPVEHAYKLSKACLNRNSQLWVVPEAIHTFAYFSRPGEYMLKVLSFFNLAFA